MIGWSVIIQELPVKLMLRKVNNANKKIYQTDFTVRGNSLFQTEELGLVPVISSNEFYTTK
jgi:hypothetical protein